MKSTSFERTITNGVARFIIFLEDTLSVGAMDARVSIEEFTPAAELRDEIATAIEKYSTKMLKLHGYED